VASIIIPVSSNHKSSLLRDLAGQSILSHIRSNFPEDSHFITISQNEDIKFQDTTNITIPKNDLGPLESIRSSLDSLDELQIQDDIFIHYSDLLVLFSYQKFLKFKNDIIDAVLFSSNHHTPFRLDSQDYSFIEETNDQFSVSHKKSFTQVPHLESVSCGLYYFKSYQIFKELLLQSIAARSYHIESIFNSKLLRKMIYTDLINLELDNKAKVLLFENWFQYFSSRNKKKEYLSNLEYVVPLAGQGSRFKEAGYETPKHLLPIENKSLIEFTTSHGPSAKKYHFITLDKDISHLEMFTPQVIKRIAIPTQGQACSAFEAIKDIDDKQAILIGVCDNCAEFDAKEFTILQNSSDVIFFSFTNHPNMEKRPEHYGWLRTDSSNNILGVSVKTPISDDPLNDQAIVGLFYFKNAKLYKDAYKEMIEAQELINGEYYIDSMINFLLNKNLIIKSFPVNHFISLGTPNEYESFFYFKECYQRLTSS